VTSAVQTKANILSFVSRISKEYQILFTKFGIRSNQLILYQKYRQNIKKNFLSWRMAGIGPEHLAMLCKERPWQFIKVGSLAILVLPQSMDANLMTLDSTFSLTFCIVRMKTDNHLDWSNHYLTIPSVNLLD